MAELKACFAEHGFADVATLLNSGNVVFTGELMDETVLAGILRAMIQERIGLNIPVFVITHKALKALLC